MFKFLHNTRLRARSEPRGSVRGADAAEAVVCVCSRVPPAQNVPTKMFLLQCIGMRQWRQLQDFCVAAVVTGFGTAARRRNWEDASEARVVGGPRQTAFTWLWRVKSWSGDADPLVRCSNSKRQHHHHGSGNGTCGVSMLFLGRIFLLLRDFKGIVKWSWNSIYHSKTLWVTTEIDKFLNLCMNLSWM